MAEPLARIPDFKIYFWLFSGGVGGSVRDAAFNSDFANWAFKKIRTKTKLKMRNAVTAYSDVAKVSCNRFSLARKLPKSHFTDGDTCPKMYRY